MYKRNGNEYDKNQLNRLECENNREDTVKLTIQHLSLKMLN